MTKTDAEIRSIVQPVERRADDDGKVTVAGYAAVFGEVTDIAGYFDEVISPGAFTETLRTADVLAYFDHDRGRILGRSSSGTLRLKEDAKGLSVEIDLPDTSDGRDVRALIERGDIRGMSFGFRVTKEQWDETGEKAKRTILAVDLRVARADAGLLHAGEDGVVPEEVVEGPRRGGVRDDERQAVVAEVSVLIMHVLSLLNSES